MGKVLYTKYNSLRRPEFQLKTSIIQVTENEKCVIKEALCKEAHLGINNIKGNHLKLKEVYKSITPIEYSEQDGSLVFPFVNGKAIDQNIDYTNDEIDTLVTKVKTVLDLICDYSTDNMCEFVITDGFKEMFPNCSGIDGQAYKISNLDAIFSNFVVIDSQIVCIDYEWVTEFIIPTPYVRFRALLYLYTEHIAQLECRISLEDFLIRFGYSKPILDVCFFMEDCFQQYVHGENRRFSYIHNYEIGRVSADTLVDLVDMKDQHISNLDAVIKSDSVEKKDLRNAIESREARISDLEELVHLQQVYIDKLRKAIRNPIYATKWATEKVARKFKRNEIIMSPGIEPDYENWITNLEAQEKYDEVFEYNPKISVLVPVYNVLDKHLIPCIESVINQVYSNWELCIADDCSTWDNVKETLKKYESHEKIKIVYREKNGHISRCTNSALELATGEYIALLDCDDILRPNALYEMVKLLNKDMTLDFIYSDEDKVDDDGMNRHMPHFKPDWSPDTLMANMYTCHFSIFRKTIADDIGGIRPGYEGAQDYDFALRFTEKTDKIGHIPKILYHWRERVESTAARPEAKPYILEAARKSKEDALERRGLNAELELIDGIFQYRVKYISQNNPLVSIIIPSKDNYKILERCIVSLYEKTLYKNYEIILVDNGSSDENKALYDFLAQKYGIKYIYEKSTFNFSKMCNTGAKNSNGEMLLFLNDDIEIIDGEWLQRMVGQCELSHVGAVGAKLLYPETNNIQHCGVIEIENGPCHAFSNQSDEPIYYFGRNRMDYNYVAVTAACLLVSREKYNEVNGFDEKLAVAYNDIDFCFKLVESGYYNVVRNDAVLYHHESVSRGNDLVDKAKMKRLLDEQENLYKNHPRFARKDPFYNPNLSQDSVGFSYNYGINNDISFSITEYNLTKSVRNNIRVSVDSVEFGKKIVISGWAFRPMEKKTEDTFVILVSDNKCYKVNSAKVYRKDVYDIFKSECTTGFIGYKTEFSFEDIEEGTYKIGVIIGKDMIVTDTDLKV